MAKKDQPAKTSLLSRIMATSTIDDTNVLGDSIVFEPKDATNTGVVLVDVALSGYVDGGLYPGLTLFAGKSSRSKLHLLYSAHQHSSRKILRAFYCTMIQNLELRSHTLKHLVSI